MNSTSKTLRTAAILFFALTSIGSVAAGESNIPDKYLSFFSEQFISDEPLRADIRPQRFEREEKHASYSRYDYYHFYYKNKVLWANLKDWKDHLDTLDVYKNIPYLFYPLIDLIYHLDRKTLAMICAKEKTSDTRWIAQLDDINANIDSMRKLVAFIQNLVQKDPDSVEYLLFMKACHESGIIATGNGKHPLAYLSEKRRPQLSMAGAISITGNADSASQKIKKANDLLAQGLAAFKRTHSEWLKLRYACQLMTLARYAGLHATVVALHDDLLAPLHIEGRIRAWALEQKTAALERLGHDTARRHETDGDRRDPLAKEREALLMIDFSLDKEVPNSPAHKAWIWAIKALDSSHSSQARLRSILRVHEFAPQSAFLESLLVWALLKCEEDNFSKVLEYPAYSLHTISLEEFQNLALWIAGKGKVRRPALWYLAAGYLAFMQSFVDDTYKSEANGLLKKAERMAGNDPEIRHQARLLRHVTRLYQPGHVSKRFRESLYPELQWLADRGETMIFQTVISALAQKLLEQGEFPQAICCLYAANNTIIWPEARIETTQAAANAALDIYATAEDLEALYAFMTRTSHSASERFLLRHLPLSRDEVLDVWGTHLLREHEFKKALKIFERIAPAYWTQEDSCSKPWGELLGEEICVKRFQTNVSENPEDLTNKLEFTQSILQLEQKARRDRAHSGEYYRQLADAFYHTPYWGYAGVLWNGSLEYMFKHVYSADEWDYYLYKRFQRLNYPFNRPTLKETMLRREQDFVTRYGARSFAMEYYHKALRAARDEKFIEEMLQMMRKCAESPTMMSLHRYHFRNVELFPKTDFYHMMMRYASTAAYRELLEEEPSFQDYVRLHR